MRGGSWKWWGIFYVVVYRWVRGVILGGERSPLLKSAISI